MNRVVRVRVRVCARLVLMYYPQGCARGPSSRGRGVQVRGEAEAPANLFEARPRHSLPRPRRGTPFRGRGVIEAFVNLHEA